MNCVLYARVSTEKQADKELSIPAQLQAMRDYAQQHEWVVVEEFLEPGASAKTAERPALQRLLSRLRSRDSGIRVVLVHKIDRLARNVYDHATIRALLKQYGIRLASVVENVDDTVSGQLVENIMASIAQFYSANLGEEVKKGMRQKVLNGGWPHLAPCGYVQVRKRSMPGSRVEIQPRLGPLVTKAFELCATGLYSMKSLATRMATEGLVSRTGRSLAPSHLRKILTNSFYTGRVRWKELDVAGQHPALVSDEIFAKVQQVVEWRYRRRGTKGSLHGVPLRGLAICASCRGHMTAERHERWLYYRCSRQVYRRESCPARFCNADRAHSSLKRICLQIQITRATAAAIGRAVKKLLAGRTGDAASLNNQVDVQQRELLDREMQLTEAFATGDLSAAGYADRRTELRADEASLVSTRRRLQADPGETLKRVDRLLELATSIWDIYEQLSDKRRVELLRLVFRTMTLGPDGIVGFSLTPPFKTLVAQHATTHDSAATLVEASEAA